MSAPWLSAMPPEWREVALQHLATIETGSRDTVQAVEGAAYPFFVRSPKQLAINSYSYDTEAILTPGDGNVGEIFHHFHGKFDAHQRVYVIYNFQEVGGRFLYWYFSSEFQRVVSYGGAQTTVASLRRSMLTSFPVAVPPIHDQRTIADYLDRETGEIDAMIAKMDELAETLELRRIETITFEISGLSSTDQVQTGDIWFPTVPRGWQLSPVQFLSDRLTDGAHISPETENGEYDFVSTRDVRHGIIDFEGSLKTSASSYDYLVRTGCQPSDGDILFSKDGTIGETAIVVGDPEFVVASSLIIVTPTRTLITPEFLRYALQSGPAQRAARSLTRGSGLPRISVVNFGRGVAVPLPSLDEQRRIADHLDEVTGKIDAMLAKVASLKSLLIERRATLITDVVTGRKKVA